MQLDTPKFLRVLRDMEDFEFRPRDLIFLHVISANPDISSHVLSSYVGRPSHTASTGSIRRLEAYGLIVDRRTERLKAHRMMLRTTEKGEELLKDLSRMKDVLGKEYDL